MVPLLGLLQYRWIGQVSAGAERERLQENLDISVRRFSDDVIREMERATFAFRLDGVSSEESMEALLTRAWEQWQLTARYPGMIAGVYVVEPGSEAADDRRVRQFEADTGDLTDVPTPAALIGLPTRLEFPNGFRRGGPGPRLDVMPVGAEGIWLPVPLLARRSIAAGTPAIPLEWVTLRLDSDFVTSTLLPDLVESHFATRDFRVAIFESPTADGVVYRSDETMSREAIPVPDATVSVFGREGGRPPRGGAQGRGGGGGRGRGGGGFRRGFGPGAPPLTVLGANWQLVVNHRLGSLENARFSGPRPKPCGRLRDSGPPGGRRFDGHHLGRAGAHARSDADRIRGRCLARIADAPGGNTDGRTQPVAGCDPRPKGRP